MGVVVVLFILILVLIIRKLCTSYFSVRTFTRLITHFTAHLLTGTKMD